MLKHTLVVAMSVTVCSLPLSQPVAAAVMTQGEPMMTSETEAAPGPAPEASLKPDSPQSEIEKAIAAPEGSPEKGDEASAADMGRPGVPGGAMPSAEEMRAEQEKLQKMTPQERHEFMRERHEKRVKEARDMVPPPIVKPPMSGMEGGPPPMEHMGDKTLEERRAYYRKRYEDLRNRAKDAGVDIPQRPPWAGEGRGLGRQFMTDEERTAHWEKMRNMTPEQRDAHRLEQYQKMRERAKEQGIEMPETPPWLAARKEREARRDKMAAYRDRVNNLSEEDREACRAVFKGGMQAMRNSRAGTMPGSGFGPPPQMPGDIGFGQAFPYAPEGAGYGQGYPQGQGYPGVGYGPGYPSAPGGGYGQDYPSSGPGAGYGQGYPAAPNYERGARSPWSY